VVPAESIVLKALLGHGRKAFCVDILSLDGGDIAPIPRNGTILRLVCILNSTMPYLAMEMGIGWFVHIPLRPLLEALRIDSTIAIILSLLPLELIASSHLQKSIELFAHLLLLKRKYIESLDFS
jgi:hypothetical protein